MDNSLPFPKNSNAAAATQKSYIFSRVLFECALDREELMNWCFSAQFPRKWKTRVWSKLERLVVDLDGALKKGGRGGGATGQKKTEEDNSILVFFASPEQVA